MKELELNAPGWKFIFSDEQGSAIIAQIKAEQEKNQQTRLLRLVKTTTGRRRIYLFAPEGSSEKFLIKAYLPARFSKRLKYLVRNSRCAQEFFSAKKLAKLGIPAVKAVAFGFRRDSLLPAEELVIEPYLEDFKTFAQLWRELAEDVRADQCVSPAGEKAKPLFRQLMRLVYQMHQNGVRQRDFKPDSILAKKSESGFDLILSDLERIKFYRGPLSGKKRIVNLGKILQSFFRMESCPEMEWLLEGYSKASGWDISQGGLRKKVVLSGIQQLKKHAEQRQSWARDTNELIEKFDQDDLEIRVSREIGKGAVDKFLETNKIPRAGQVEIAGKKLEMIEADSAKAVMQKYFYLRELKIKCRPVLLAVDFKNQTPGVFGLEISESEKTYAQMLNELSRQERLSLLAAYAEFISRLEFFGLDLQDEQMNKILVAKSASTYEFLLASPEQINF